MELMGIGIPILSIVTYIPLAGALAIVFFLPKERTGAIKTAATLVAVTVSGICCATDAGAV